MLSLTIVDCPIRVANHKYLEVVTSFAMYVVFVASVGIVKC